MSPRRFRNGMAMGLKKILKPFRESREHRRARVIIVSYPKSGRTWLRAIVARTFAEQQKGVSEELSFDSFSVSRAGGALPTRYTHDDTPNTEARSYTRLERDKSRYRGKKVIFLCRDPRDVLVSCYFQATRRHDLFDGSLSEFLRSDEFGIRKILTFYNIWYASRDIPSEFLLLHYEDLHQAPHAQIRNVLAFMGIDEVDPDMLDRAIAFSRFENMRKLEETNYYGIKGMRPKNSNDAESYKVRKGKVGGYSEYLSPSDCDYADQMIKKLWCPFLERGRRSGA